MDFDSILDFTNHLNMAVVPNVGTALEEGLDEVGQRVVEIARAKFGSYQRSIYKFPKWAPLAEATKTDRAKKGFSPDGPLLRTGTTRDSIGYAIRGDDLIVGSSESTMVYHEVGTKTEPPRPVLGPALYEARNSIREIMGKATVLAIVPGSDVDKLIGFRRTGPRITSPRYDFYRR